MFANAFEYVNLHGQRHWLGGCKGRVSGESLSLKVSFVSCT